MKQKKDALSKLKTITQIVREGATTYADVAEKIDVTTYDIGAYIRRIPDVKEEMHKNKNKARADAIRLAIMEGADSRNKVMQVTKMARHAIRTYASQNNIVLPIYTREGCVSVRPIPEIDALVHSGLPLRKMAAAAGKRSFESARSYLIRTGQYDTWWLHRIDNTKRAKKLESIAAHAPLIKVLKNYAFQRAKEKGFAYEKTTEYLNSYKNKQWEQSYGFEKLFKLFRRYERAKKSERKVSLAELGKGLGIWPMGVSRILDKVGLERFYWKDRRLSEDDLSWIEITLDTKMSGADIAYFLEVDHATYILHTKELRKLHTSPYLPNKNGVMSRIPYRDASRIYEAQDLKFKPQEISELLDINEEKVEFAIKNRDEIEKPILKILRFIYGKTDVPYRSKYGTEEKQQL